MTREGSAIPGALQAERLVMLGLELDSGTDLYWLAVDELASDRPASLLRILDQARPRDPLARSTWSRVVDAAWVGRLIDRDDPDFDALDLALTHLGIRATDPILELLSCSESLGTRRQLYARLVGLGPDVAPLVVRRLDDERWYARRNMLALLGEFERWPPKWSPSTHAIDPHPAVRREALKLMLREPDVRDRALCSLLTDEDPRAQALGLAAAIESCPPEAVPLLGDLSADHELSTDHRVMAVRALGLSGDPAAVGPLVGLIARRGLLGPKLADKSTLMLAALAALARFPGEPVLARRLLARAAKSSDPEVRAAALRIRKA